MQVREIIRFRAFRHVCPMAYAFFSIPEHCRDGASPPFLNPPSIAEGSQVRPFSIPSIVEGCASPPIFDPQRCRGVASPPFLDSPSSLCQSEWGIGCTSLCWPISGKELAAELGSSPQPSPPAENRHKSCHSERMRESYTYISHAAYLDRVIPNACGESSASCLAHTAFGQRKVRSHPGEVRTS